MNSLNKIGLDLAKWTVYNAKLNGVLQFDNQEIKGYLMEHSYKEVGRYIRTKDFGIVWIDFVIHSEYFN